ncbi:MAG: terpene cyclase/mutase family protein [Kiritimatiellae bacterium]|nr:terpene cyclase/mutase family protein [Kiritimatiellia bacterium]
MAEAIDEEAMNAKLKEEMKKYDSVSFFQRLGKMFSGLSKRHDTLEYKEALIEVQRLSAPLLAILIPVVGLTFLFVITAMGGGKKEVIKVDVQQAEEEAEVEAEEPPPPEDIEPPPDTDVEIDVDTPAMNNVAVDVSTPVSAPSSEPQSPKPAEMDAMLNVKSPVMLNSVAGTDRSAGVRGKYTNGGAGYGDARTEAAVQKALWWLASKQNDDGSWKGWAAGSPHSKAASTGLAILTFLAHGETPGSKDFGPTVEKGIEWLISNMKQRSDGYWTINDAGNEEYGFLIAVYALSEAFAMTKNPNAKTAAANGLRRMIDNQSPTGGWNYRLAIISPSPDDISYGGWCMQAIKAGKLAGIHLDGMEECIKKAIKCLKERNYNKDHGFSYRPMNRGYAGLGGVGCLAMQLLGYGNEPAVRNALDVMKPWIPCFDRGSACPHEKPKGSWESPQYTYYYATQCKYQAGMKKGASKADEAVWQKWNAEMKKFYPSQQKDAPDVKGPDGKMHKAGYWENGDAPGHTDRPIMDTCLCALQLMVYYRYLPTSQTKAAEVELDVESLAKDKTDEIGVDDLGI